MTVEGKFRNSFLRIKYKSVFVEFSSDSGDHQKESESSAHTGRQVTDQNTFNMTALVCRT